MPSHMKYTIWLDQAGVDDDEETGMKLADPEAGVVLTKELARSQSIDRCFSGAWSFFHEDIEEFEGKWLQKTGKKFFLDLATKRTGCPLTFDWNSDFTFATITGYFPGWLESLSQMQLSIGLAPYWKWKFGLVDDDSDQFSSLDQKCCPPTEDNSCEGYGAIGTPNTSCETISSACGEVHLTDMSDCTMWLRRNTIGGTGMFQTPIPFFHGYNGYPIGDANGKATGYFDEFESAMQSNGVNNIFYGLSPPTNKKE